MDGKRVTISGKFSADEAVAIREFADQSGRGVSALTRELWLEKLGRGAVVSERLVGEKMIEFFARTMYRSLSHGEEFTAEEFLGLCREFGVTMEAKRS